MQEKVLEKEAPVKEEYGKPGTWRSKKLKDTLWWKHTRAGEYAEAGIRLCMDRVRIITRVHKESVGEPEVIRRGKSTKEILSQATVVIREDELIVGMSASAPNKIAWHPEAGYFLNLELLDTPYVEPEDEKEVEEIINYWIPYTIQGRFEKSYPLSDEGKAVFGSGVLTEPASWIWIYDSPGPGYESILKEGFRGKIGKIEKRMQEVLEECGDLYRGYSKGPELAKWLDKYNNLLAMKMASEGIIIWAKRHARLARIVAENFVTDERRKKELLEIARICDKIPGEPADSLHEAIQAHWFAYLAISMMERECCGAAMKYDELFEPYYDRSVKERKEITHEQAVELIECQRLKFSEKGRWQLRFIREITTGSNELFITTVGGVRRDGSDACSDCSDAILEAAFNIRTAEPSIVFRWHPKARSQTLKHVYNCVRTGLGYPSIKNDAPNISSLLAYGASLEEARNWAVVLCMSPHPVGDKGQRLRCVQDQWISKILEIVFYDGEDPTYYGARIQPPGSEFDPPMRKPEEAESWEELLEMLERRMKRISHQQWTTYTWTREIKSRYYQQPLLSTTYDSCIREAEDCTERDELPDYWWGPIVALDAADALVGLKKLVFEEKKYTMKQVIEAMRDDWEGHEEMRRDFLNAPKFGSDDDYADEVVREAYHMYSHLADESVGHSRGPIRALPQSINSYATWGPKTGALPNGRKQGDPLADGGISPWLGCDKKGPTAVLKSVSKVDNWELKGLLLNMRLNPSVLRGEKGFGLWHSFMKGWEALGLDHVQYNCTSTETLRAAQEEPEKYADVMVRVAGYSAKFIDLSRYSQDTIIAREEHALG